MAYLGVQPNKTLTKTTSQSFNGTGSATTFTLNRAVNTEEELEVFVENVQQEPGSGKSYTATGTTLTFDEAPPSGTGNIYVIYRGLAEVTTRLEHDANQALSATTGTFSGAVSGTDGTFTGDLTAPNLISGSAALVLESNKASTERKIEFGNDYFGPDSGDDNAIDLGRSGARFNNIFLGGGAYIGGTGNANKLEDYEEGTWTPTVGGTATYTQQAGQYTKVGRMVFVRVILQINAIGTGEQNRISGLPFASNAEFTIGVNKLSDANFNWYWVQLRTSASYLYMTNQTALDASHTDNPGFLKNSTLVQASGVYHTNA